MYIGMVFKKSRVNDMMFLSSTRFPPVEILYPQVHLFSSSQGEERRQKPSIDRNDWRWRQWSSGESRDRIATE